MNLAQLIWRSLRHYARAHLGTLAGCAVAGSALVGSLVVGDSVRESLRQIALSRLGPTEYAVHAPDRYFAADISDRVRAAASGQWECHPVLLLPGRASQGEGSAHANHVNVVGVRLADWASMSHWNLGVTNAGTGDAAYVNETLANQLSTRVGDELIVRLAKPGLLGLDAVVSPKAQLNTAIRVRVAGILDETELGNFSLSVAQTPPANLFMDLSAFGKALGMPGRANVLAFTRTGPPPKRVTAEASAIDELLRSSWRTEDSGIEVRTTPATNAGAVMVEIVSSRVFLDAPIVESVFGRQQSRSGPLFTNAFGVLTYLANLLQAGGRAVPYSMIAASGDGPLPSDMGNDEIVVNQWLADDLAVGPGERVQLTYYVPDSGSGLLERTNQFRVKTVVPVSGAYADRTLMPEFPGLATAESTHDWDTGFPLVYKIRGKDEDYWRTFRGTPKAFIPLAAGQAMWTNRFGALTSIRIPIPPGTRAEVFRDEVRNRLTSALRPAEFGMQVRSVRAAALKAASEAQDFGQLFLGFSFFLVAAALLLMGLLYRFNLEERASETGMLLAVGFPPSLVRRMRFMEGAGVVLPAAALSVLGGTAFARAMVWGLGTLWREAVGTSKLMLHVQPQSLFIGALATVAVAVGTMWLTLRKQARQPARELLTPESTLERAPSSARAFTFAVVAVALAAGLVAWACVAGDLTPGVFFCAGALLLSGGLGAVSGMLSRLAAAGGVSRLSFLGLGLRGAARRSRRSLAVVGSVACGTFMLVAVGAFHIDAGRKAVRPTSGTGGFAFLAESASPIPWDPRTAEGREAFGLSGPDMAGTSVVPFRVRDGDEASCLNLVRAQQPRLLGVDPERLKGRFAFTAAAPGRDRAEAWELLTKAVPTRDTAIPAIGDANSIKWALEKKLGDCLDYTDEHGRTFKVQLVGALANSILQGSLVIDERAFAERFPAAGGYRFFLVDAPSNRVAQAAASLERTLEDYGFELTPTVRRLGEFNAVQNTYLGTFQVLGGIGLLIGSAGLGVVVLRNVLERRGELGLLVATGFTRQRVRALLLYEHAALLLLGLALGVGTAVVAVLPALLLPGSGPSLAALAVTLAAVLINGLVWTCAATTRALRGNLLDALRGE